MIPTLPLPDSSLALLADPYRFVSRTCDRLGVDGFRTVLMGRRVTFLRGAEAARMFYEGGRFHRRRAIPRATFRLLQDEGSAQVLEGESHRHRKAMFLALLTRGGEDRMGQLFEEEFSRAVAGWRGGPPVVLHEVLGPILAHTVFRWAGIPDQGEDRFRSLTLDLIAMFERAATVGPLNWLARIRRRRTERWAADLVAAVREGRVTPPVGSPLATVATWTGDDGRPLPEEVAAVELLNLLRPTVAIERFLEFAVRALAARPSYRASLAAGGAEAEHFAHEVRRHAPFFAAVGGRVRQPFRWRDHDFQVNDWVMLDIHGTNHDARLWPDPQTFRPERFRTADPRHIVAQGGGDYLEDHRCPGEPATNRVIEAALRVMARSSWRLEPGQNLRVAYRQPPARIRSGLRIRFA